MRDFEYETPMKLEEALASLARSGHQARPLAGGTDLIDHVRSGRLEPDLLIDVKQIAELNVLELSSQGLRLGAAVNCRRIAQHADLADRYAALADSCRIIGGIQIQNRASVGGNLCNSGPAADTIPSLIVLSAICVIAGPQGTREVPVEQFCTGPGKNILQPGELLVELRMPAPLAHSGSHYRRFIPRNEMDIAVVGVGASVQLDPTGRKFVSARIALGAVAPTPLLANEAAALLAGQEVSDEVMGRAAAAAQDLVRPITDMRGTAEFRGHLTGVLTRRVLGAAVVRARGEKLEYHPGK